MTRHEKAKALLEFLGWTDLSGPEIGEPLWGIHPERTMSMTRMKCPNPFTSIECARELVKKLDWHQKVYVARLVYWQAANEEKNTTIHIDDCMVYLLEASPADISEAVGHAVGLWA
jgi:hypothetical protein